MSEMVLLTDQAVVNVTYNGSNGDMVDPVPFDASEADIRRWVTEAVQSGSVVNIPAMPNADFSDFVVEKFSATATSPNRILLRPKTPFGISQ